MTSVMLKPVLGRHGHTLSRPAYSPALALSFLTQQYKRSIHDSSRFLDKAIVGGKLAHVRARPDRPGRGSLVRSNPSPTEIRRSQFHCSTSRTTSTTPSPVPYAPPKAGLISRLPPPWIPYAELIRLDKPTGTYYLFFPCLFSTLLAAPLATPITPPLSVVGTTLLFLSGALIMRGAGCTINDLWDRDLDPHVTRTRLRPIARGAVSPRAAVVFTGFQLVAGLGILLQFPISCLYYGIPSLLFVTAYPLAKRVTYYPQFVLGLTFSWGALMGFPALGVDLLSSTPALTAAACLYASNVAWTVLYDMIYAHMDIRDDAKAGIKSIVLRHEANTKVIMTGLAAAQVSLLAAAGLAVGAGPIFFIGSCGSAVATLGVMIWRVQLKNVADCWWWFRYGCWFTGSGIAAGLLGEYVQQYLSPRQDETALAADAEPAGVMATSSG